MTVSRFLSLKHPSTYTKIGYTQSDEQTVILKYLAQYKGNNNRFLDIGAYDGVTFSNTRALIDLGWRGVYVEPCPVAIDKLLDNTEGFKDRITIIDAAISDRDGQQLFYSTGEMIGTLDVSTLDRWEQKGVEFGEDFVQTITPATLLEDVGPIFDMVSIDVEGRNADVVKAMPWKLINPKLIIVEHDHRVMVMKGYTAVFVNSENAIFVRNDLMEAA